MPKKPVRTVAGGLDAKRRAIQNQMFAVSSDELQKMLGVPAIEKPAEQTGIDFHKLNLPQEPSRRLAMYMQYANGMLCYALATCAEAENKLSVIETAYASRKAKLHIVLNDDRPKWQIDADVESDPELSSLKKMLDKEKAVRTLLKAHVAVWDARVSMISREQSRRANELQRT